MSEFIILLMSLLSMFFPNFENGQNITIAQPNVSVVNVYEDDLRLRISGNGGANFETIILRQSNTDAGQSYYIDGKMSKWETVATLKGAVNDFLLPRWAGHAEYAVFFRCVDEEYNFSYSYPVSFVLSDDATEISMTVDSRKPLKTPRIVMNLFKENKSLSLDVYCDDPDIDGYVLKKKDSSGVYQTIDELEVGYNNYSYHVFEKGKQAYGEYMLFSRRLILDGVEYSQPYCFKITKQDFN